MLQPADPPPSPPPFPLSGVAKFYGNGAAGNQQGALGAEAGLGGAADVIDVSVSTLDAHLASVGEASTPILVLKIDTEGFDGHVLKGAEATLRSGRVKVVSFEYNAKWRSAPPHSLQSTVELLSGEGYNCYMITDTHLVPLYGEWWDGAYEFWWWSNAACFKSCSVEERVVVAYHNVEFVPIWSNCK